MRSLDVLFVTTLRFVVFLYAKAENLAPGNAAVGQNLAKRAVRIRCAAENVAFANLVQIQQSASSINLSQQKKSDDSSLDSSSSFLNHVLAVNSRIYKCNSPIVQGHSRILSRLRRGVEKIASENSQLLNTDLSVMFDCLTTKHTVSPDSGRKSVVILSSNAPELWEFSKVISGDDCQLVGLNSYASLVQEPKIKVQGAAFNNYGLYGKSYTGSTRAGPGRRRKITTTHVPVPIAKDVEYPEAFKNYESTWNNNKDSAVAPVRPRLVQQSVRKVQIEWRNPHKGVPVDYYRVQYMKDDGKDEWLPCHEGNLGSRVRSFRFEDCMLFRRYKFRIYAHYENGEHQFSAPTTWFKLETWN